MAEEGLCTYLMKSYLQASCRGLTACLFKLFWCDTNILHIASQHGVHL